MSPEIPADPVFEERIVDGVVVISLERGLKGMAEYLLKERIDALVRDGRLEILIDMTHMPRLDSTELGRLIRAHISARQRGAKVRMCCLSERVMTLMKMTRLDTVLDLHDTEEEALNSIRHERATKVV